MRSDINENLRLFSSRYVNQKEYWKEMLSAVMSKTDLDFGMVADHSRSALSEEKDKIEFSLADSLCRQLLKLSKASDLSIYIILLSCLKVLIFRYTHQEDITVISPVYRHRPSDYPLDNRLYIRNSINGDLSFRQLILEVRRSLLGAYENQDYPYRKLVEFIFPARRGETGEMISGVLCSLTNIHDERNITGIDDPHLLTFSFSREAETIAGSLSFHADLYQAPFVKRIVDHLLNLLESLLADVNLTISAVPMLTDKEEQAICRLLNGPRADYAVDEFCPRQFETQVRRTPHRVALVNRQQHITYDYFMFRVVLLAGHLIGAGVRPETVVGIRVQRSPEMFIGLLGIWRAGGAYLPLDPEAPESRCCGMLRDSGVGILLSTHTTTKEDGRNMAPQLTTVYIDDSGDEESSNFASIPVIQGGHLAYIIYTSGSTGIPRGVMVEHGNLAAYLAAFAAEFNITCNDSVVQQAAYYFDTFAEEVYPVLFKGGKLAIPRHIEVLDTRRFVAFIVKHRVSIVDCSPLLLSELNQHLVGTASRFTPSGGRFIFISGGDVLKGEYIDRLVTMGTVYNTYGPTETTVCAAYFRCHGIPAPQVPIGRPIAHYQLRILGPAGNIVPAGVEGELCIAGAGVSRGYLNNPELTGEKFILPLEFSKIYRSGDLARLQEDGNVTFIGRLDSQVKVRGFRIEPGEIEAQLCAYPEILEAVVTVREDEEKDKFLCAYVVTRSENVGLPTASELRNYLLKRLPHYMVPAYFVLIDRIPVSPTGKIDRSALPEPRSNVVDVEYIPPRDDVEKGIAAIWARVLGIDREKIGIDSNFFELGGHSLKATIVIARIQKDLQASISMTVIFTAPTIRELAEHVRRAPGIVDGHYRAILPVERREYYDLSPAQKRIYFLQAIDPDSTGYNISQVAAVEGTLSTRDLEEAFEQLIGRHESLRTAFINIDGEPVQRIYTDAELTVESYPAGNSGEIETVRDFVRPFDLSATPLFRVGIGRLASASVILMVDMHHIVSDGVSLTLFIREFLDLFNRQDCRKRPPLPALKIQYKDFSRWQNEQVSGMAAAEQETFWLNEFASGIPFLDLPVDFPRPRQQSFEGRAVRFELGSLEAEGLSRLGQGEDASLFMLLLAVYFVLLYKISGRRDIVVGTAVSCRNHADIQQVLGVFVNVLPFRNFPSGEQTFREFLRQVRRRSLAVLENQEYQFEDFFEKVEVTRKAGRHPLYEAGFTLQNIWDQDDTGAGAADIGIRVTPLGYEIKHAKLDVNLECFEMRERLSFIFTYRTRLFRQETILRWVEYFKSIVMEIIEAPDMRLEQIDVRSDDEKQAIGRGIRDIQQEFQVDFDIHTADQEFRDEE